MGRPKHDFWQYVKGTNDAWECKFCGHKASGGSRIKSHLLREKGKGIAICEKAPRHMKEVARHSHEEDNNIPANSSDLQGVNAGESECVENEPAGTIEGQDKLTSSVRDDDTNPCNFEGLDMCFDPFCNDLALFDAAADQPASACQQLNLDPCIPNASAPAVVSHNTNSSLACLGQTIAARVDQEGANSNIDTSSIPQTAPGTVKRCCATASESRDEPSAGVGDITMCQAEDVELPLVESQLGKKRKINTINQLADQRKLRDGTEFTGHFVEHSTRSTGKALVGKKFQSNIGKMWELLRDEKVTIIGLYGMGGVGKTALAEHIYNQILAGVDTFDHTFWVNVSQDFCVPKLQHDIANELDLEIDMNKGERRRAEELSKGLIRKHKFALILDDVWNKIDLERVGIILGQNIGNKLILTSRLLEVFTKMNCPRKNIIKLEPLSEEDGWELFLSQLQFPGTPMTFASSVEEIARSIAKECNGLPLGIKVMATCMKGVEDMHEWRHALCQLQNSSLDEGDMEEEVFKILRRSYDHLDGKKMQDCFLYCALYPENFKIKSEELIMHLADEGLINGTRSLQELFDEGFAILNKLVNHSLLENCRNNYGKRYVKMHDLNRDMACRIIKLNTGYMVKSGKGLKDISRMEEWTVDLKKVFLMQNKLREISSVASPKCPQLSTVIISGNPLHSIADCFFLHMNALNILDLSETSIVVLPNSISNLKSLVSLLLRGCQKLKSVPPLGELQALTRLDLSRTLIGELPQGLERLTNLKWLDLAYSMLLKLVPGSVLPSLINIQYLKLDWAYSDKMKVKVEDLKGMHMLENFEVSFQDCDNFNAYASDILSRCCEQKSYILHLGESNPNESMVVGNDYYKSVVFINCRGNNFLLPNDVEALYVSNNYQWTSCLCDVLFFDGASSLRYCEIKNCHLLESLFCLSRSCSLCTNPRVIESLHLISLRNLAVLWKENGDILEYMLPGSRFFSNLKHLKILDCNKMEKLLSVKMLSQLQNLATLYVQSCDIMKEIFSLEEQNNFVSINDDESSWGNNHTVNNSAHVTTISLPRLQTVVLSSLPELKTVCRAIITAHSLQKFAITSCPGLEEVPQVQPFFQIQVR